MEIKYCIPSRGRPKGINKYSISFLLKNGINPKDIYVFINPKNQEQDYLKEKVDGINYISLNANNIAEVRNHMIDYFDEGDYLVMLDDDITGIVTADSTSTLKIFNIKNIFQNTFKVLERLKLKLAGFEPTGSYLNLSKDKVVLFGFAIQVICLINTKVKYDTRYRLKEDIYYSCLNKELYGGVLISYNYTFRGLARTNSGGCQDYRKDNLEAEAKNMLLERFPLLLKEHNKKPYDVLKKTPNKRYTIKI